MARKISAVNKRQSSAGQAETELSALVRSHLGVIVTPGDIRKFVAHNFTLLSILAHEIHAADDASKGVVRLTNS